MDRVLQHEQSNVEAHNQRNDAPVHPATQRPEFLRTHLLTTRVGGNAAQADSSSH